MKINPNILLNNLYASKDGQKLLNKIQIRATVIDSNINNVKILLENGKELSAKSNIPLDSFLGEKLTFKILEKEGEVVLRPLIDGRAQQKETDIKISKLLSSMDIQDTKQNREIARQMVQNEIPVTKENFANIKETIAAFEKLKFIVQGKNPEFDGEIENILQKEIRDLVKEIVIDNRGSNVAELKGKIDISMTDKKDILFLYKNGYDINIANINALNSFFNKNESVVSVLDSLGSIFEQLFGMGAAEEAEGEAVRAFDRHEDTGKTANAPAQQRDGADPVVIKSAGTQREEIAGLIKKLMSMPGEDGAELLSKKEMLKSISDEVEKLLSTVKANKGDTAEAEIANQKLKFLYELSHACAYMQVPVKRGDFESIIEMLLNKKSKKHKNDFETYSIFFSADTQNFSKVTCNVEYSKLRGLEISFGLEQEKDIKTFKANTARIIEILEPLEMNSISVKFQKAEKRDIISTVEPEREIMSNFDMWV